MADLSTRRTLDEPMISAQFRIQLPGHLWVSELSREFPRAKFTLLSGFELADGALELGEVTTERPDRVLEAMRSHRSITSLELLESESDRLLTKYETPQTDLYEFAARSTVAVEFPVEVRNGWYRFDLTGTREELDELRSVLDAVPLSYELESLVTSTETDSVLTDRQRELLEIGVREGYFTVPRECTLAELADTAGVDKSTASTILRRAQSRLVKRFLTGPESRY